MKSAQSQTSVTQATLSAATTGLATTWLSHCGGLLGLLSREPCFQNTKTEFGVQRSPNLERSCRQPDLCPCKENCHIVALIHFFFSNIVPDVDLPDDLDTHNVMQWGQFVDHDLTHTPLFRLSDTNSSGVKCCSEDGSAREDALVLHPQCFPVDIPSNDPFYKKHGQRCMNFVRSMPGPGQDCTFGYAEQMNQVTHLMDSSMVYGSDEEDALELRQMEGGLMKTYRAAGAAKELLPQEEGELEGEECAIENSLQETEDRKCFKAGDSRSNEHTGLTAYHTVWMREHNRLARELAYLNPHWDDERLYQEAKRILTAEMQHITYNEWLPIVLGPEYMAELDILPLDHGYSSNYDEKINPTILNSFATAAFRFGHTLIQGMMK